MHDNELWSTPPHFVFILCSNLLQKSSDKYISLRGCSACQGIAHAKVLQHTSTHMYEYSYLHKRKLWFVATQQCKVLLSSEGLHKTDTGWETTTTTTSWSNYTYIIEQLSCKVFTLAIPNTDEAQDAQDHAASRLHG